MSGSSAVSRSSRTPGASPWRANCTRSRRRAKIASSSFSCWCVSQRSAVGTSARRSQNAPTSPSGSRSSRFASSWWASVSRTAFPIQVGTWMPFVTPRIRWGEMPCQVASAVSAWSWLTAFASWVRRSEKPVMSKIDASPSGPSPSSRTASTGTPPVAGRPSPSRSGPAISRTRSAANRSLPAGTGVWIVKTLSARTRSQAASRSSPPATSSRARSASMNAEWPSFRCQTAGSMPRARSTRTPPTPRTSSWWSRISRPRTYRMFVIGRSASSFSGMSVSSRRTGVRPTWTDQTAIWRSRPGRATVTVSGSPSRPWTRPIGQRPHVVVRVGVLLVAVGVDRLVEVAVAVEQPDADERQRHVGRGLHVVAGQHAEAARVDAERLATGRTRRRSRRPARAARRRVPGEPAVRAVGHVAVEVAEDGPDVGEEVRVVEEPLPVDRAAQDRDRVAMAGPGRPVDPAPDHPRPRVPRPVEVVGERPEPFQLRGEAERGARQRGHGDAGRHGHAF